MSAMNFPSSPAFPFTAEECMASGASYQKTAPEKEAIAHTIAAIRDHVASHYYERPKRRRSDGPSYGSGFDKRG